MIAKIIAHGSNRDEALARLHRALSQTTVLVHGGTTNKSFLLDLLERPEVRAGEVDTAWLDRLTAADEHLPTRLADVALVAAAVDASELQAALDRAMFLSWASRGRPQADTEIGREVELRHGGQSYRVAVRRVGPTRYEVELDGVSVVADVERMGRARSRLTIGDRSFTVVSSTQGSDHLIEVDGVAHRFSRDDAGIVRAPAAALVVDVDVVPDDVVEAGDRLAVVEAMKMEIAIPAPVSGRVRDVFVARNVQVDAGTPLFRIEPTSDRGADREVTDRIDLAALRTGHEAADGIALVRASMLGFDVEPAVARRWLGSLDASDAGVLEVLDAFSDLCALVPGASRCGRRRRHPRLTGVPELVPAVAGSRARRPPRLVQRPAPAGAGPLRRVRPDPERRADGCAAAHLHRPAAAQRSALGRRGPARGPPAVRRAARGARPDDRSDPSALPGDRQPRPGGPVQPLRPPAHRTGPGRGLGHDDASSRPASSDRTTSSPS